MKSIDAIPAEAYLQYSLTFNSTETNLCNAFMDWLPDEIIDCHAHCNSPEHVIGIDEKLWQHMMTTFPGFSLEQSYAIQKLFYPSKNVRTLRFPNAFRGIDHKSANDYLLEHSRDEDRVALYGIPTDINYTTSMMKHEKVAALKMYYLFFDPPADKIYKVFPPDILEEAQSRDIPIILHLPKMITQCREDLRNLVDDFPRLTIVLAHLGLPHLPVPGLIEAYEEFALRDNVLMDTAMIPSAEVVKLALAAFGLERIMFGSDEPLHMIRSVVYNNPSLGQRLATEYPYHWVDPLEHKEYGHLAKGAVHTHWQALSALRNAIESLPPSTKERAKNAVFRKTATAVYGF